MAAYHCEEMGSITQELHAGKKHHVCIYVRRCNFIVLESSWPELERNTSSGCLQDFGEYQESYYSVQTTEGEQISQLIAGYIDIILKKVTFLCRHTGGSAESQ